MKDRVFRAIGLMSGTSADGVDAALIETDGCGYVKPIDALSLPYEARVQEKIRKCFGLRDREHPDMAEAERLITHRHAKAVTDLMEKAGFEADDIDYIGFHGQTVLHVPEDKLTWQIGDAGTLARQVGIHVVHDFRKNDVKAGGQGAPFLPLYHQARVRADGIVDKAGGPVAILNIGGVSNITWIGQGEGDLIAFDAGPGNALMDDYVYTKTGQAFDEGGALASKGRADQGIVDSWMALPYFARPLPKSLDRNSWDVSSIGYLSLEDALATLSQFTVDAVKAAETLLPEKPKLWMVTGGGRLNANLMRQLSAVLDGGVTNIDEYGWNGDALEAEGFAYLAVRSVLKLPLSLPGTTGVAQPTTGGLLHKAS